MAARICAWVVGNAASREMQSFVAETTALLRGQRVSELPTIAQASALSESPDLVVVLQNWSTEYTLPQMNALLAAAPQAHVICAFGAWCESDGRSHELWPTATRVPVRNAADRVRRELDAIRKQDAPLPLTAGRDEAFAWAHAAANSQPMPPMRVRIQSADRAFRDTLATRLHAAGATVVSHRDHADVVLWDPGAAPRSMELLAARVDVADGSALLPVMAMPHDLDASPDGAVKDILPTLSTDVEIQATLSRLRAGQRPLRRSAS